MSTTSRDSHDDPGAPEPLAPEPAVPEPAVPEPAGEPPAAPTRADAEEAAPAGRRAAPRPYPPTAPGAALPAAEPDPAPRPPLPPDTSWRDVEAVPPPPAVTAPAPVVVLEPGEPRGRRDVVERPAKPGAARHVLAGLLGLVLTPVALLLVGVGIARLADIAGTSDMGSDVLGVSLLVLGVALLAAIVLLGVWSVAMPVVGGLVWGLVLGIAYLAVPGVMEDAVAAMTADGSVPAPVDQLAQAAMSGYLVVVGALLVCAGIATAVARRSGRRWATQLAAYERAQAERAPIRRD